MELDSGYLDWLKTKDMLGFSHMGPNEGSTGLVANVQLWIFLIKPQT